MYQNSTQFADSPRVRGTHTLFRNLIRLDYFRLGELRHARFNQPFSGLHFLLLQTYKTSIGTMEHTVLRQVSIAEQPHCYHCVANTQESWVYQNAGKCPFDDPELRNIVEACSDLPDALKSGISAMVSTTSIGETIRPDA